jgi:hypothetical protein
MVAHQAVGVNLAAKLGFPQPEIVKIIEIILIPGKDYLPVMTSLDDMMWVVRKDYS